MWDLVSSDEVVDRVASDPEQRRDLVDVEHDIDRLLVIRWTHEWRRDELGLVRVGG